jgi:hypothetical protein
MSLSNFESTMLEASRRSRPDPARRQAARAAVLASVGVGTTLAPAKAAAATVESATKLTLIKLIVPLLLAAGAAGALLVGAASPRAVQVEPRPVVPMASVRDEALPSPPASVADPPGAPATSVAVAPAPPKARIDRAPPEDALLAETRLLDAARTCLGSGDTTCAERRLAEHAKRFGVRGVLGDEAAVLAIDCAKRRGDEDALRTRCEAFLVGHAASPYAKRVRSMCPAGIER